MSLTPADPNLHVTVAAIIEHDGRFLMIEEIVNNKQVLNQPAGHIEPGETFVDAVIRETLEESAIHFLPEYATGIYRWTIPGTDQTYLRHCFTGKIKGYESNRSLDDTILRTLWLDRDEIQQQSTNLRSPLVLACIDDYLAGQRFPLSLYQSID